MVTKSTPKKGVLFFVPTFVTLSEKFIEREIVALANSEQVDVIVVSLEQGNSPFDPALKGKVHYVRLSFLFVVFGLLLACAIPLRVAKASRLLSSSPTRKPHQNMYLLLKSLGYAVLFMRFRFSHIHCQFLSEPSTIGLLISVLLKKEFSLSAHARDVFGSSLDSRLNAELVREKAQAAKFISVCNKKAYDKCVELSGNSPNVLLRYHGVPLTRISQVAALSASNVPSEAKKFPVLVAVGRFVEKKGFTFLIEAAKQLRDKGVTFNLKIIGYGPLQTALSEQIKKDKLGDCVSLLGKGKGLPNDQVIELMSTASICVLPSIETEDKDAEGIPNTLVEAAALSKPIVATDTGSIPEVFTNDVNALIVPSKSSVALADSILRLLQEESLADRLGKAAHAMAVEKFDLDKNVKGLEALLVGQK